DLGQGRFVDLEQPQLGVPGRQQARGDPGDEVRAGTVVRQLEIAPQDLGSHRGGRRLAVRRRNQRRAEGEAAGELVDRPGVELPEQFSWHGCPAADAGDAREGACRAGKNDLELQRNRAHGRTLSAGVTATPFGGYWPCAEKGGCCSPGTAVACPLEIDFCGVVVKARRLLKPRRRLRAERRRQRCGLSGTPL